MICYKNPTKQNKTANIYEYVFYMLEYFFALDICTPLFCFILKRCFKLHSHPLICLVIEFQFLSSSVLCTKHQYIFKPFFFSSWISFFRVFFYSSWHIHFHLSLIKNDFQNECIKKSEKVKTVLQIDTQANISFKFHSKLPSIFFFFKLFEKLFYYFYKRLRANILNVRIKK